ncbi:hypothetical protein GCK72_001948 [Caenorhabditis remanei]|uniref:Uncharacterized protein n=1 Tax=Caenorhabditis remanei TaxID=31234 RepID=A0A6A5HPH7_CAERE|nr:hypothetical protein GCK72_001948 [Caenorhabditis remanei]KAF1770130.1 hypothetical protein GCK72_001948 [Caenorhabditis remanei]
MKRLFDFSIIKTLWAARLQSLFESIFGKTSSSSKSIENPVQQILAQKAPPKTASSIPTNNSTPSKREMHSSAVVKAAAFRKPMIKFIGARLPRPFFDAKSLPPLQVSGNFPSGVSSSPSAPPTNTASSIGPVGKIPRGQGIDWNQLPQRFQRQGMSEEECEAVNTGFFYRG